MSDDSKSDCFILAVGSTGMGKSRHMRLLTGQDIKYAARNDPTSCTQGTSIHNSNLAAFAGYKFIDTQGAEDTKNDESDNAILEKSEKLLHQLYEQKEGDSIKIFWFVKPSAKAIPALQAQAKFISSFEENIWKSVYVIIRQPTDEDMLCEDINGTKESMKMAGGDPSKLQYSGHTCIEWLDDKMKQKWLNKDKSIRYDRLYFTESELKTKLLKILETLPNCSIFFANSQCKRCGIIADKRFCSGKCHTKEQKYHLSKPTLQHKSGSAIVRQHRLEKNTIKYHPKGDDKLVHGTQGIPRHVPNAPLLYTHGSSRHPGSLESDECVVGYYNTYECPRCGSSDIHRYRCTTGSFMGMGTPECGSCGRDIGKGDYYHCHNCCCKDTVNHSVMKKQCSRCCECAYTQKTRTKTKYYYSCCKRGIGSNGCACERCGRDTGTQGCNASYGCCGRSGGSEGCQTWYECCQKNDKNDDLGCRYACCPEKLVTNNSGCEEKQEENFPCCGKDDEGCKEYYDCCNAEEDSDGWKGCEFYYQCCKVICSIEENNNEETKPSKDCGVRCQKCQKPWGKDSNDKDSNGHGCEPIGKDIKHEWEDIE